MTFIEKILEEYPPITYQMDVRELHTMLDCLEESLLNDTVGDIVEFGCYAGTTSLYISRLLKYYGASKQFYVYDSFEGLPEKTTPDLSPVGEQFAKGELSVSKHDFVSNYRKANLPLPSIHKGWFNNITPAQLPTNISFAFLDGDFYESIIQSLMLIDKRLTSGAFVIVDDYQSEALPGAAKAVNEWAVRRGQHVRAQASLAIMRIP